MICALSLHRRLSPTLQCSLSSGLRYTPDLPAAENGGGWGGLGEIKVCFRLEMRLFLRWRRAEIIKKDGLRAPVGASVFRSGGNAADGFPHTYKWHSRKIEPNIITLFWVPRLSPHARAYSRSGSQRALRHTRPPAELQSHHQPTPAVKKLIGSILTHNTPLIYYSCQSKSTARHFSILPKHKKNVYNML